MIDNNNHDLNGLLCLETTLGLMYICLLHILLYNLYACHIKLLYLYVFYLCSQVGVINYSLVETLTA